MQTVAIPGRLAWGHPTLTRRAGDAREAEFAHLFEEFSAPIYNYVLRIVADADRAADITQDTFIKAYRKLDTVTDATSTRSWLYRIATNTAIDDMRRRRMVTPMGDDAPAYANRPDPRPGPEEQVMASTLDDRVQRALLRLRPNHRQCLLLSDLDDMSAQQIGEVMNLSYAAVRTLLCRARGEMRRALAAEGFAR
ncbi:MAG TPA: RNA polymerase sigma factor [Methylomirabilota bacterium]|nr:RNA polymerase sigma factor [Methylomirabilota bacterium]